MPPASTCVGKAPRGRGTQPGGPTGGEQDGDLDPHALVSREGKASAGVRATM
jgi:hypothetical protein